MFCEAHKPLEKGLDHEREVVVVHLFVKRTDPIQMLNLAEDAVQNLLDHVVPLKCRSHEGVSPHFDCHSQTPDGAYAPCETAIEIVRLEELDKTVEKTRNCQFYCYDP